MDFQQWLEVQCGAEQALSSVDPPAGSQVFEILDSEIYPNFFVSVQRDRLAFRQAGALLSGARRCQHLKAERHRDQPGFGDLDRRAGESFQRLQRRFARPG